MPTLFNKNPLQKMAKEHAEDKIKGVAAAQEALKQYEDALKLLPRSHALYKEREKLLSLRQKELTKIMADRAFKESDKIKQIKIFTHSLQTAFGLFPAIKDLKVEIDNPKNDVSERAFFKNHKNKEARKIAREFLPAAQDVYEHSLELAYSMLNQRDLHQDKKEADDLKLLTRVVSHTSLVVKAPTKENIKILLHDKKELNNKAGIPLWHKLLGAVVVLTGVSLLIAGLASFPWSAAVTTPAAEAMIKVGFSLYGAGMGVMLIAAIGDTMYEGSKANQASVVDSHLNHLITKANKLVSAEEKEEIELRDVPVKPSTSMLSRFIRGV